MAYQTRNTRSTRPGNAAVSPPETQRQQPQIVYLPQGAGATGNNANNTGTQAAGYMTTLVNQITNTPDQQKQGQQQQIAAAIKKDAEEGYEDILDEAEKMNEDDPNRPKWMKKRKDPAYKVSKKVRRKRMNARLRRLLQPKNAIMVLNELKDSVKFSFQEQTNAMQQNFFIVTVEVDGQNFTGQGMSKPAAKQSAAENALKALLLEKMTQSTAGLDTEGDVAMKDEPSSMELGPPGTDVPPGEEPPLLDEEGKPVSRQLTQQPEDDVPWGSLASFALFKLFNDWQSQGTQLPIARTGAPNVGGGGEVGALMENRGPAPMKKLPDNPTDRHPVMLLNQLRPALIFNDVSTQGVSPNVVFTVAVTVDGIPYQGMGKNKKEAKKEAAKAALAAVFNIHYDN